MEEPERVTEISLSELRSLPQEFYLVDVLPRSYFRHSHLPGAINLPVDDIADSATQVLPDKSALIVVYCQNYSCAAAEKAVSLLQDMGYENVRDFKGGKDEWRAANLQLEGESRSLKK